jgi:hypothetical protein
MSYEPSNRRGCCWPMWPHDARPNHMYCGDPKVEGSSYCQKHKSQSIRNPELEPATPFVPYHQHRRAA